MCGICGQVSLSGSTATSPWLSEMIEALRHRGPDSAGRFGVATTQAGMRRLAVIDLEGGSQPFTNESGSVHVVSNGEIYNFRELREQLERTGHRFRSDSDTEVLVHLWEDHGPAMLDRLHGMFAFCLTDARDGTTMIARDRLGVKPLYYHQSEDRLVFASEIAALLRCPAVPSSVSDEGLADLFCLQYVPGDRTVYEGIRTLAPGQFLLVRDGVVSRKTWWKIPDPLEVRDPGPDSLDTAVETFGRLFRESVRERLVADVPLGVFLSGGLDSSGLLATMTELGCTGVETFSVGFDDAPGFDERPVARRVADRFGARHDELTLNATDVVPALTALQAHAAHPVLDPALIPTWLLARHARERVTVVLTGEGSDELFCGYRRHAWQQRFGWARPLASMAGATCGRFLSRRARQALDALAGSTPEIRHLEWSSTVGLRLARDLLRPEAFDSFLARSLDRLAAYFPDGVDSLSRQLRVDQSEWLPNNLLAKVDLATMAHALEARVPYLDHRLVEWAATLPDPLRARGRTSKRIVRAAFAGVLPADVIAGPKRGFDLPLDSWMRGPLSDLVADRLLGGAVADSPVFDGEAIRDMLDRHSGGEDAYGMPLFALLSIGTFLETHAAGLVRVADS